VPLIVARKRPPFDNAEEIRAWLDKLNQITEIDIANDYVYRGAPDIPMTALSREQAFNHFIQTAQWTINRVDTAQTDR
jgi:hypothetical protein